MLVTTKVLAFNFLCSVLTCNERINGTIKLSYESRDKRSSLRNVTKVEDKSSRAYRVRRYYPLVTTFSGPIEGYMLRISKGKKIFAFEGIPYAESTSGHRRFRDPVPKKPWILPLKAKRSGPMCTQLNFRAKRLTKRDILGSEDCLTLNVYSPAIPSTYRNGHHLLPVIINIHGGKFYFGTGSAFGPSYILHEPIVLVTINFRQGVFGYLSTHDEASPGNYALKDQALALKWIHTNIKFFGGDPYRITLMGQSSGACATHLHMMSPLSQGLYKSVVSRSACAFNHWCINNRKKSYRLTMKLARLVRCPTRRGSHALMKCFRSVNPTYLLIQSRRLYDFLTLPPVLFAPVVEPPSPTAFLLDTPENLYAKGYVARVPWIVSLTTEEADATIQFVHNLHLTPLFRMNWRRWSPHILDIYYIARNATAVTNKIRKYYMGSRNPATASLKEIERVVSDRYFRVGIHKGIQVHSQVAPTYGLLFGAKGRVVITPKWKKPFIRRHKFGVGHGEDNAYIFNSSTNYQLIRQHSKEEQVSRVLNQILVSFAYTGKPQLKLQYYNDHTYVPWDPVKDPYNIEFLLLNNQGVGLVPEPRPDAIRFWENLGLEDTTPAILPNHYRGRNHLYQPSYNEIPSNGVYDEDYEYSPFNDALDYIF